MSSRVIELILCLAFLQTVSVNAQQLAEGDKVQTPHFTGQVDEVINKGSVNEEVRVSSDDEIKTSAIYPSEQVQKLSARERRLLKAQEAGFVGVNISVPMFGVAVGVNGTGTLLAPHQRR